MSRLRRTAALFALLAYVAISTIGVGWVLCYESDGHVAVESLATGCCGDDDPADHDEPADHDDPAEHDNEKDCGDCVDLLLIDALSSREAHDDVADLADVADVAALALLPAPFVLAPTTTAFVQAAHPPPRPPPQLAHLRTTHLLL